MRPCFKDKNKTKTNFDLGMVAHACSPCIQESGRAEDAAQLVESLPSTHEA